MLGNQHLAHSATQMTFHTTCNSAIAATPRANCTGSAAAFTSAWGPGPGLGLRKLAAATVGQPEWLCDAVNTDHPESERATGSAEVHLPALQENVIGLDV